jgi:predicted metal-dependent hydrolase
MREQKSLLSSDTLLFSILGANIEPIQQELTLNSNSINLRKTKRKWGVVAFLPDLSGRHS